LLHSRRSLALVTLALGLVPVAWAAAWAAPGDHPQGGVLVFARGADSVTLDPPKAEDGESVAVIDNVFDGLVRYADEGTAIEPSLAESWTHSDDGKTWTFALVKDVKFHDGTPFTAQSVVFTFERLLKKDHPFYDPEFVNTGLFAAIEKVEAVNPLKVAFHLSRPVAAFLGNLTVYTAKIVCPEALKKMGAKAYAENPIGTGAFVFKKWERKQKIVLTANKDYWKGRPYLDEVRLVPIPENEARWKLLESGKVQVMDGVSPTLAHECETKKDLVLLRQQGMNVGYFAMNCEKKPFNDAIVRRAVALALDPKRIVDTNFQGMGTAARNLMPPFVFAWDAKAPEAGSHKDEAKKLLLTAGVTLPLKIVLHHMATPRPYFPEPKQTAIVIQDDLKAVGIEAELETMDWSQYLVKTRKGEYEACIMGWTGDTSDPDNFLYVLCGKDNIDGTNVPRYADVAFNQLCLDAQSELDDIKRAALYVKAQQKLREDAPLVPLVHADQLAACSVKVHDMKLHPTGRREFRQVWLDQ
jgi:peptide/nickel transport system substrate-binding protein